MSARRLALAGLMLSCGLCGNLAFAGVPAQAAVIHKYLSQESPAAYTPFNQVTGIAVDNSTNPADWAKGDVYEAGVENKVVDVFRPTGGGERELVAQLQVPNGNLYNVAVNDLTGEVITWDANGGALDVFRPALPGQFEFVRKITSPEPGQFLGQFFLDETNGELYVVDGQYRKYSVVDQFSSTGVLLNRMTGADTPAGTFRGVGSFESVSIDPATHYLYILDEQRTSGEQPSVVDIFSPDIIVPDVTTGPASSLAAKSVVLTGTVNPDEAGETSCEFLWGPTTEFGHVAPCEPAQVGDGGSEVSVKASLSQATGSELEPDTTYCYRLQATNANGTNAGYAAQDQCFTTLGPGRHAEAVSAVAAESVTFDATINPHNTSTTYYFQYGTTASYGTNVPAAPGAPVGSGEGDVNVSQHVQKLESDVVYHYRVVVLGELQPGRVEEFDGPDQTFTTQRRSGGTLTLPDGRSWELVTPADKHGALFFGQNYGFVVNSLDPLVGQASVAGDAMIDLASQPTEAEPQGSAGKVSVLSTRGGAGWSSQVIAPPNDQATSASSGEGAEYRFFSEDLSHGILQPFGSFTRLSPEGDELTAYLRTDYLNGNVNEHCHISCFQPLVSAANTRPGAAFGEEVNGQCPIVICGPYFVDATPDLKHVILSSPVRLTLTPAAAGGFYEWSGGQLQLVSVLPDGTAGALSLAGAQLEPREYEYGARHAISDDGGRVVLASFANDALYLRDTVRDETVRIDVPQGGTSASMNPGYMTASRDAARIFFRDSGRLTTESSSSGPDLYEYDVNAPLGSRLKDLSADRNAGEPANAINVLGTSSDGSYVYFVAGGALAQGASRGGCPNGNNPDGEACNIYVSHDGVTRLVAANWPAVLSGERSARVSSDGRRLTFMSSRGLTGYDTHDAVSGRSDVEVYLYDANANRLICASCNPTGGRPAGAELKEGSLAGGSLKRGIWVAASLPPNTKMTPVNERYQPRYLSDSGRLFFNSDDALVPQDVNGAQDVYEYEPSGVGGCTIASVTFSERSDGCVGLISSGSSHEDSAFMDASETGGDVFFITESKLLTQDFDNALDVYDAHECSTVAPCYPVAPVSPPVCSTGDSCKAAPSPQPAIFGVAPSATFSGAGNVIPLGSTSGVRAKSLTRAQKLAGALRVCRKKDHARRAVCERKARRRYGPAGRSRKANAKRKGGA
jgi:hypothetical protein